MAVGLRHCSFRLRLLLVLLVLVSLTGITMTTVAFFGDNGTPPPSPWVLEDALLPSTVYDDLDPLAEVELSGDELAEARRATKPMSWSFIPMNSWVLKPHLNSAQRRTLVPKINRNPARNSNREQPSTIRSAASQNKTALTSPAMAIAANKTRLEVASSHYASAPAEKARQQGSSNSSHSSSTLDAHANPVISRFRNSSETLRSKIRRTELARTPAAFQTGNNNTLRSTTDSVSAKVKRPFFNCTSGTEIEVDLTSGGTDLDRSRLSVQPDIYLYGYAGQMGCGVPRPPQSPDSSTSAPKDPVNRYVGFTSGFLDGRGIGNQLFNLASVVYVAQLTGRRPAILRFRNSIELDEIFQLGVNESTGSTIERGRTNLCPAAMLIERCSLAYDDRIETLARHPLAEHASIFLTGYFQSWRYVQPVDRVLRRRYLAFRPEVAESAVQFLSDSTPRAWKSSAGNNDRVEFVRVGVHVRRGNVLSADNLHFGYTTPSSGYFRRAMRHFVDRYRRVQFVICGNDVGWMTGTVSWIVEELKDSVPNGRTEVTSVMSVGHSAGHDLAVLASCDHVIISTGTFGWWGAWLAGGKTIYYADWPRRDSELEATFRRDDFFPPDWIGMNDD